MVLVIVGGILAALGILAGGLLVAAPLGWIAASPGLVLWVLFPLFTLVGYALLAVGSRDPAVKAPTRLLSVPLLLVAVVAAVALVADGAGLLSAAGGTAPLWFVMLFGGVLGIVGAAVSGASRSG